MPVRSSVLAAVCVLLAVAHNAAAQGQTDKTLLDPKNQGNCINRFNDIIQRLYTSQKSTDLQQCGPRITQAMNATSQGLCPPGDSYPIQPGSPTHFCMNQNGTQAYLDEWAGFIKDCEVMYIAFRAGSGESEEGVVTNSCFPLFKSYNEFRTWLYNSAPYAGKSQTFVPPGSSNSTALPAPSPSNATINNTSPAASSAPRIAWVQAPQLMAAALLALLV